VPSTVGTGPEECDIDTAHAVAGIDPHKHTATIAVVNALGVLITRLSFAVTESGVAELLALLRGTGLVIDRVGVEGSGGLGRPLTLALAAAGYDVREVPASRTAERRKRRRRAKTDTEDAEAIARETLSDPGLPPAGKHATPPASWDTPVAIRDRRESLVLQRKRLLNEAEPVLVSLPLPVREQLPTNSRVRSALKRLSTLGPTLTGLDAADRIKLARLAATLTEVSSIDGNIKALDRQIPALLADLGCTLTDIHGIGVVTAMTLLTEVGDPHRFTREGQFARWCGAAPIPVSSGEGDGPAHRHRLDLGGNRQVNSVLHIVHVTQARAHPPARTYLARREAEKKTKREARRAHKRQLANVIIRHMWNDADHLARRPKPTKIHAA
jgi:transposase